MSNLKILRECLDTFEDELRELNDVDLGSTFMPGVKFLDPVGRSIIADYFEQRIIWFKMRIEEEKGKEVA